MESFVDQKFELESKTLATKADISALQIATKSYISSLRQDTSALK